jgi:hypothetical protein
MYGFFFGLGEGVVLCRKLERRDFSLDQQEIPREAGITLSEWGCSVASALGEMNDVGCVKGDI